MELVTGRTGEAHITSQQDRQKHQGVFGEEAVILETGNMLTPELQNSNEIHIKDGALMYQGALFSVKVGTYDRITINNGNQGKKRKDLIVARYTYNPKEDIELGEWGVIQGEPTEGTPIIPEVTTGDIQKGDTVVECPVFVVTLDGINVTGIDIIPKRMKSIPEIEKELDSLNGKIPKESDNYVKFPDGTLMQWGTVESPSGGNSYGTISLPVPFANMDYRVLVEAIYPNPNYITFTTSVSNVNTSQVTVYFRSLRDGSITGVTANWLAIGKWK